MDSCRFVSVSLLQTGGESISRLVNEFRVVLVLVRAYEFGFGFFGFICHRKI